MSAIEISFCETCNSSTMQLKLIIIMMVLLLRLPCVCREHIFNKEVMLRDVLKMMINASHLKERYLVLWYDDASYIPPVDLNKQNAAVFAQKC